MKKKILAAVALAGVLSINTASAQSLGDLLGGFGGGGLQDVVEELASEVIDFTIEGSWKYEGVAVKLNTDNALAVMGASVAENQMEQEINSYLQKLNIDPKNLMVNFNADGTFNTSINERRLTGTYTYNAEASQVELVFLKTVPVKAKVEVLATTFSLLFNSDELLKLMKTLTDGSSNSTISAISAILEAYDGMEVGAQFYR